MGIGDREDTLPAIAPALASIECKGADQQHGLVWDAEPCRSRVYVAN